MLEHVKEWPSHCGSQESLINAWAKEIIQEYGLVSISFRAFDHSSWVEANLLDLDSFLFHIYMFKYL